MEARLQSMRTNCNGLTEQFLFSDYDPRERSKFIGRTTEKRLHSASYSLKSRGRKTSGIDAIHVSLLGYVTRNTIRRRGISVMSPVATCPVTGCGRRRMVGRADLACAVSAMARRADGGLRG